MFLAALLLGVGCAPRDFRVSGVRYMVPSIRGTYVRLDGIWHVEAGERVQQLTDPQLSEALLGGIQYPEISRRAGVAGEVTALVHLNARGTAQKVTLEKEIGGGCDEAVAKAIQAMPFDTPYLRDHLPTTVRVQVTFVHEGFFDRASS